MHSDSKRPIRTATATGGSWLPLEPKPEHVRIEEIAIPLARLCRYGGQINEDLDHYSVAEHSVLMLDWAVVNGLRGDGAPLKREEGLAILFHDGPEAFLGDMITPIKRLLPDFKLIEGISQNAINAAMGITIEMALQLNPLVKNLDSRIGYDEREALILEPALTDWKEDMWQFNPEVQPLGVQIACLQYRDAKAQFLDAFLYCMVELEPGEDFRENPTLQRNLQEAQRRGAVARVPGTSQRLYDSPQLA